MLLPVKVGFAEYMKGYFEYLKTINNITAETKSLADFILRDVGKCIVWCPTRMVDQANEMLGAWQRNDTDSAATTPYKLPVIAIAFGGGYMPTGRDYSRRITVPQAIILDNDVKERVFKITTSVSDVLTQIVFFTNDPTTVYELAESFVNYVDNAQFFNAKYIFAGLEHEFPVQVESPEFPVELVDSGVKNICINAVRLNWHVTEPHFYHPKDNEPNDGKGTDGDINDLHGYPVITGITGVDTMQRQII